MTTDELIERVRASVNNIEVDATPHETALAMLKGGMTVAVIAWTFSMRLNARVSCGRWKATGGTVSPVWQRPRSDG